jgi:ribose-phosphate pyrophosphokinase
MIVFNNTPIEFKKFPNGEVRVERDFLQKYTWKNDVITLQYESDADLVHLYFLRKMIHGPVSLRVPYFPYSRMDRASNEFGFTLRYIAELINSLEFEHVYIYESHSDVTMALIDNSIPIGLIRQLVKKSTFDNTKDFVLFPDGSAYKHYSNVVKAHKEMTAVKKRDFKTGRITQMDISNSNPESIEGKRVYIVDDLCSKGGTFLAAAEKLKEMGAEEINLIVAHCEESIWDGKLMESDLITWIWTTNTIPHRKLSAGKLTIFDYSTL